MAALETRGAALSRPSILRRPVSCCATPTMFEHRIPVRVLPQPTETTCGPTCLHGVYQFWGDVMSLAQVIEETGSLSEGGTLSVFLAHHAQKRGYRATIYTYNVQIFDPTWFELSRDAIVGKLHAQAEAREDEKLRAATRAYIEFFERGGDLRFENLGEQLIRDLLTRHGPVLTGLSATFLYRMARERPDTNRPDDVAGHPVGHFVVLAGHRPETRELLVADPWDPNPLSEARSYWLDVDRVIGAILLGIITYDANLLIIEPNA
jgi:hypothetical protein